MPDTQENSKRLWQHIHKTFTGSSQAICRHYTRVVDTKTYHQPKHYLQLISARKKLVFFLIFSLECHWGIYYIPEQVSWPRVVQYWSFPLHSWYMTKSNKHKRDSIFFVSLKTMFLFCFCTFCLIRLLLVVRFSTGLGSWANAYAVG